MATTSVQLRVFDLFGSSLTAVPFQNFLAYVPLTGFRTVVEEISSSRNSFLNLRPSGATPLVIAPGVDTRVVLSSGGRNRTELYGPSYNPSPRIRGVRDAILELNDWGFQIRPSDVFLRNLTAHAYFTEWPSFAFPFPFPDGEVADFLAKNNETMSIEGQGTVIVDCVGIDGNVLLRRYVEVGGCEKVRASGNLPLEFETDNGVAPAIPRLVAASDVALSIGGQSIDEFTAHRCREMGVKESVVRDASLPDSVRSLVRGSPLSRNA